MSEFTPITTQEEFDSAIKDRLARERAKFSDYETIKTQLAEANSKVADYEKTIDANKTAYEALEAASKEKDTKIAGYEADALKTTVAINKKLPINLRKYLQGSTEEELNASADELIASGIGKKTAPPLKQPENDIPENDTKAAYLQMAKNLKKEN